MADIGGVVSGTLGLFRMFGAGGYQRGAASTPTLVFMVLEGILLLCGILLTFKAHTRREIGERYTAR